MIANRNFEQCEPLTWFGRVPVYLSTAIAFAHGSDGVHSVGAGFRRRMVLWVAGIFATIFSQQSPSLAVRHVCVCQPARDLHLIQLVLLAFFGRDVEKFIGRKAFAWFYAVLVLAIPILLSLLSFLGIDRQLLWLRCGSLRGLRGFVMIYPGAEIFFGIQARWIAIALLGITLCRCSPIGSGSVFRSWWSCGVAALWMMREGVRTFSLPSVPAFRSDDPNGA